MYIVDSNQRTGYWTGGESNRFLKVLLSPFLQKGVEGVTVGMVIIPPGSSSNLHSHDRAQEIWYVIEGEGLFEAGESRGTAGPGDIVFGPPSIPHRILNPSIDKVLKALWILCPNGDEEATLKEIEKAMGKAGDS